MNTALATETPRGFDWSLLCAAGGLSILGLMMMYSMSMGDTDVAIQRLLRHAAHLVLALIAAVVSFSIPVRYWRLNWVRILCLLGCVGLLLVTLTLGVERNEATRWVILFGQSFQPTEMARLAFVVFLASFCAHYQAEIRYAFIKVLPSMSVVGIILLLLLLQPDHGSMLLFLSITLALLFLSGLKLGYVVCCIAAVGLPLTVFLLLGDSYVEQRIFSWLASWQDPQLLGYQARQALYAHGMGGWFGAGLGQGVQKFYLPEAHTDFIVSGVVEEMGAITGMMLIAVLFWLTARVFQIGRRTEIANDKVGGYICYGIGAMLCVQLTLNLGGNLGLLPIKGFTLPFISYGGSSLLATGTAIGLVLRIDRETRRVNGAGA